MKNVSVKRGSIVVYRLFDAASFVDLSLVESMAREHPAKRLMLSRRAQVKALEFSNPPVSLDLKDFTKDIFGTEAPVKVFARAYDFGVISISFSFPIPSGSTFDQIEEAARTIDEDASLDLLAREYVDEVLGAFAPAITDGGVKEGFVEDYAVFFIEEIEWAEGGLLQVYDPSRLLLYETGELSPEIRKETLVHRFSYHPDDLVILHYDNALVVEPSGNRDLLDILEFANAQLLELRYYDGALDRELNWIYPELQRRGRVSIMRLRQYERLAMRMTEAVRDITEVTEKVNNAIKVTEDVYFARIYRTAMRIFRSADWEESIREKIGVISDTYRMLHNEISIKRGHLLEATIIILILVEIVFLIAGWW